MESKVNYTAVGFFVVVFTIGAFMFALWLAQLQSQKVYDTYWVLMPEAATGLSINSQVQYNGVEVGFVSKIQVNKANLEQVKITLQLEQGTPITTATKARLLMQGLTGITVIGLHSYQPSAPALKAQGDNRYPIIPTEASFMSELDTAVHDVSQSIKQVSESFDKLLSDQNLKNFSQSLGNIEKISDTIAKNSQQIDRSIKHADELLANFSSASKEFPQTMDAFRGMSVSLKEAGTHVTSTMKDSRTLVKQLSQDTVPEASELIRRLNSVAANIESVSRDLKQNPGVIVRGKVQNGYGPGEGGR